MKKIMFLMVLVVLLVVPVVSYSFSCGEGTCDSNQCCCASKICCPKEQNFYCSGSNTCYSKVEDAKADCGDKYTVCSVPAE
jgi:hypothetical protein